MQQPVVAQKLKKLSPATFSRESLKKVLLVSSDIWDSQRKFREYPAITDITRNKYAELFLVINNTI